MVAIISPPSLVAIFMVYPEILERQSTRKVNVNAIAIAETPTSARVMLVESISTVVAAYVMTMVIAPRPAIR
jgi:hypothetical protein